MKSFFILSLFFLFGLSAAAQISHGGVPYDWRAQTNEPPTFIRLPIPDIAALKKEDKVRDMHKEIPYRFGANIPVDFDLNNSGQWTKLENGDRVWRLGIEATGALTVNFEFDTYILPKGAKVFVYGPEKRRVLGSFTAQNASPEKTLGVGFIFSDKIIISYYEPAAVAGEGKLHINQVTHGYRNAFMGIEGLEKTGEFGQSGPCNINVNCPEGLPFGIEKQSVALIIVNGNAHCSGALINTTANDETPYFLTANHCLNSSVGSWVFYFNFESPGCSNEGEIPNQSMSGATLKASNENSDFGLLLLNNDVPQSYNPCFSGWDASDEESMVVSAYGIHHPSGDIKKICFENDAPYHASIGGFANDVWYIDQWEAGVTEGGSSGSPLFSQSGRIIGQLAGGISGCNGTVNNGGYDFYGRFGVSWNYGNSAATRLKDWLDPLNTGQLFMYNSCQTEFPNNDIILGSINDIDATYCNYSTWDPTISVVNVGSNEVFALTLHVVLNGVELDDVNWSGNLLPNTSENISLGNVVPAVGANELYVEVVNVNNMSDPNTNGNISTQQSVVFDGSQLVNVTVDFDNYASETSWEIVDENNTTLYSGGTYEDGEDIISTEVCLGIGCYSFIISDQFGDGICCNYGLGSYYVLDVGGDTLATGSEFNAEEITDFCITSLNNVENQELKSISIYPNPTKNIVHISFGDHTQVIQAVAITDALGRTILHNSNLQNTNVWDLNTSSFNDGVYFITVKTDVGITVRRLVVMH